MHVKTLRRLCSQFSRAAASNIPDKFYRRTVPRFTPYRLLTLPWKKSRLNYIFLSQTAVIKLSSDVQLARIMVKLARKRVFFLPKDTRKGGKVAISENENETHDLDFTQPLLQRQEEGCPLDCSDLEVFPNAISTVNIVKYLSNAMQAKRAPEPNFSRVRLFPKVLILV